MSPPTQTQADGGQDGFTLIELLVAIALFSLVSLILLRSLGFGLNVWQRGKAHADRVDHVLVVQDVVRRLLDEAYPFLPDGDPTRRRVEFSGTTETLRFLAPAPSALGGGGRSRLQLSVDHTGGTVDLVLTSDLELANGASRPARKVLLANASAIQFSYFGKGRSDRAAAWRDDWTDELSQPKLVRIQVRFASADSRFWPDLFVAPRIGVDVGCVYDPLIKQCRGR